jgi:hypothetical protein
MAGSVLPGLVVMAFEGDGVLEPTTGVRNLARWFIGHESAHFWLGQTVRYESALDSWITEGGADLMAVRALQAVDPAYGGRSRLQAAVDDCIGFADEPVSTAADRGEFKAHYACGAVFARTAEAAQKRATSGDWFDFLQPLIAGHRRMECSAAKSGCPDWTASRVIRRCAATSSGCWITARKIPPA